MKKGHPFLILFSAILLLFALSFIPFSKLTGGRVKNFSLLSDIIGGESVEAEDNEGDDAPVDPELLKAQKEAEALQANRKEAENGIDTIVSAVKKSRMGDIVVLEDYTTDEIGLLHLKKALKEGRLARIAVVGDSYIEGDIITQDLRHLMQNAYGGKGVGFVPMSSIVYGFRQSVHENSGWKLVMSNEKGVNNNYLSLSERYCTPQGPGSVATFTGSDVFPELASWDVSQLLFICPVDATVSIRNNDGEWVCHNIKGSKSVQCITTPGTSKSISVKASTPSFVGLGLWLDGNKGVSVDNISSRGYAGITLANISRELCHEMGKHVDYDVVILQYGMNALAPKSTDFSVYSSCMVKSINAVRAAYPNADIILMGIGDKGKKSGGEIKSAFNLPIMVSAQRDAARRAHCIFWNTREAMGGEGAVVKWVENKEMNKDYTHLTHKGGAVLANELFKAIQNSLK